MGLGWGSSDFRGSRHQNQDKLLQRARGELGPSVLQRHGAGGSGQSRQARQRGGGGRGPGSSSSFQDSDPDSAFLLRFTAAWPRVARPSATTGPVPLPAQCHRQPTPAPVTQPCAVQTSACTSLPSLHPLTHPGLRDPIRLQASRGNQLNLAQLPPHLEQGSSSRHPRKTLPSPPPASPHSSFSTQTPLVPVTCQAPLGLSPALLAPWSTRSTFSGLLAALTPIPSLHSGVCTFPGHLPMLKSVP